MGKVKAIFFLPLRDNDGTDLRAQIEDLKSEIFRSFDGWTFLNNVTGAFAMSGGSKAVDENEAYMVVMDQDRIGELETLLRAFKNATKQESIYLEIHWYVEIRFVE